MANTSCCCITKTGFWGICGSLDYYLIPSFFSSFCCAYFCDHDLVVHNERDRLSAAPNQKEKEKLMNEGGEVRGRKRETTHSRWITRSAAGKENDVAFFDSNKRRDGSALHPDPQLLHKREHDIHEQPNSYSGPHHLITIKLCQLEKRGEKVFTYQCIPCV